MAREKQPTIIYSIKPRDQKPKERILYASKELFAKLGYNKASIRKIASLAGVDPRLVMRHFGSKELLFLEAMIFDSPSVSKLFNCRAENLGQVIVDFIVSGDPKVREVYVALINASGSLEVRQRTQVLLDTAFRDPIKNLLSGPDKKLRATLIVATMTGLMNYLWVLENHELSELNKDDLAQRYTSIFQSLIDDNNKKPRRALSFR